MVKPVGILQISIGFRMVTQADRIMAIKGGHVGILKNMKGTTQVILIEGE